jgi:hypothetical protein
MEHEAKEKRRLQLQKNGYLTGPHEEDEVLNNDKKLSETKEKHKEALDLYRKL